MRKFSFLRLLTTTHNPLRWRTRHRESDHIKLRNTQTEPRGESYIYLTKGVRAHLKQHRQKHIDHTLDRNRSSGTKHIKYPGTHRLGLLTTTKNTQEHIDWDYLILPKTPRNTSTEITYYYYKCLGTHRLGINYRGTQKENEKNTHNKHTKGNVKDDV
jgi:hypothetical protein